MVRAVDSTGRGLKAVRGVLRRSSAFFLQNPLHFRHAKKNSVKKSHAFRHAFRHAMRDQKRDEKREIFVCVF